LVGISNTFMFNSILSLQPELLYVQNRFKDNAFDFIELPVLFKIRAPLLNIIFGPSMAANIPNKEALEIYRTELKYYYPEYVEIEKFDINLKLGICREFLVKSREYELEIRYNYGLRNIAEPEKLINQSWSFNLNVSLSKPIKIENDDVDFLRKHLIKKYSYIMNIDEKNNILQLDNNEKLQNFIDNFWKKRDPTPGTKINEYQKEYETRVNIADSLGIKYETDRGRVLLVYGKPDDIAKEQYTEIPLGKLRAIKSFEIWVYDRPGGINKVPVAFSNLYPKQMKFLFADIDGVGIYSQIFSTEQGEVVDPRLY
jgi:GWxTD domain-containing protein